MSELGAHRDAIFAGCQTAARTSPHHQQGTDLAVPKVDACRRYP